jgi:hypothetical protein
MDSSQARAIAISIGITAAIALGLSLLWHVPYIYSVIGLVTLSLVGYVVTVDEDLPGGWAPIPGGAKAVWLRVLAMCSILAGLIALAAMVPSIRAAGGG